ncbi:MAG: hypothetical protein FWC55_05650, partial [Firmicutes bacterium]|nr:hypothetical protein [Bacillota bacterium]
MKRKLMATLLALAMALAMLPATAFADISSAAVSTAAGNLVLRLNKAQFDPGEKIIASVDGITKNYEDDIYLCVFLCNPSDPIDKYIDYWWIRGTGSAYRDDISAPTTEGKYEIRLFTNGDAPSQSTLVSKIEIKVGNTGTDMQMSLNKTDFAAGETMVVTLTGVTQADAEKEPLVALCNPGQAHGQYADPNYYWWMTDGGLGTRQRNITAPNKNGAFELRLYANGNNVAAASFVMKIDITISGASASSG